MTAPITQIARLAAAGLGATDPGLRRHALEQIAALASSPTTAAAATADGPLLIVTRGLPGSGKTTWARAWVAEAPERRARLNRDDVRAMLHGRQLAAAEQEAMVTAVQHAGIRALLDAGVEVVADDTNLSHPAIAAFSHLAANAGARLQIQDLTNVPVDECVRRDAQRTGLARLGEKTIRRIYAQVNDHLSAQ